MAKVVQYSYQYDQEYDEHCSKHPKHNHVDRNALVYHALIFVDDANNEGYCGIDQKKKRNYDVVLQGAPPLNEGPVEL